MTQHTDYPVDSATRECCGGIGGHTQSCSTVTVERHAPPPVRTSSPTEFFERDTYATVTLGAIVAEVLRLSYWDPSDRAEGVETEYEVHVNGLPDNFGLAQILADDPSTLTNLAAVCTAAAELLAEVQR